MKYLKTKSELENIEKIEESKFSRVATVMRGLVPAIKTMAILTAENPYGEKATPEENKKRNAKLEMDLSNGQYGYRKVLGKYGHPEKSFIVNNITLEEALRLGEKYEQESIVFGKREEEGDYVGMKFNLIYSTGEKKGQSDGEMNIFVHINDADDYYTKYKGRKFSIPFFGITEMIDDMKKKTKSYDDTKWDGGTVTPSDISIEDIEEVNKLQESALSTTGSSSYIWRGKLRKKLRSLGLE